MPALKEEHIYDENNPDYQPPRPASSTPKPCDTPIWALARDAPFALSVDALSETQERQTNYEREAAQVRIVASLKGPAPWIPGTIVKAHPFSGCLDCPPFKEPEHFLPGKRYIVFPVGMDREDEPVLTRESPIELDRCGVQEDTPEVRRELEKGLCSERQSARA